MIFPANATKSGLFSQDLRPIAAIDVETSLLVAGGLAAVLVLG